MITIFPPPFYEAIAVPEDPTKAKSVPKLIAGFTWLRTFSDMVSAFGVVPQREAKVNLSGRTASIGVTPLPIGSVVNGIYRVSYCFRVTRPGSISSTLTITLSWTEGGVAMSASGAAATGNTTATGQRGTLPIRVDANTPISYSVAYSDGGGGTSMAYSVDIVAEILAPDTV